MEIRIVKRILDNNAIDTSMYIDGNEFYFDYKASRIFTNTISESGSGIFTSNNGEWFSKIEDNEFYVYFGNEKFSFQSASCEEIKNEITRRIELVESISNKEGKEIIDSVTFSINK